jgi:hypothetical protein
MARGTDLSKSLDPAELTRIRALLAENPPNLPEPGAVTQYPRMLFHASYLEAQQEWKKTKDETIKKVCVEKMAVAVHIVTDVEEEEEFLLDGWKHSPADFLPPDKDPRIPVGRELRKALGQQRLSREDEIQSLRLRLAELTGRTAPAVAEPVREKRPYTRRKKLRTRRTSQVAKARAAVETAAAPPAEHQTTS